RNECLLAFRIQLFYSQYGQPSCGLAFRRKGAWLIQKGLRLVCAAGNTIAGSNFRGCRKYAQPSGAGPRPVSTVFSPNDFVFGSFGDGNRSGFCFGWKGYHSYSSRTRLGGSRQNLFSVWSRDWNNALIQHTWMGPPLDWQTRKVVPLGIDGICLYWHSVLANASLGPVRNSLRLDCILLPFNVSGILVCRKTNRAWDWAHASSGLEVFRSLCDSQLFHRTDP